ncbi:MAG: 4Fe-4S ferredoxin, partial [Bacteroidetes bacterium]|nr:4Fe-4S ferredoxin [Bacteroidota bacterium]
MMKFVQKLGLLMFLGGFFLFIFSFFLAQYSLTEESIQDNISDLSKQQVFIQYASPILGKTYTSNFPFVADLQSTFEQVNQKQLDKYGLNDKEVAQIVKLSVIEGKVLFKLAVIDQIFDGEEDIDSYKRQSFKDYGSWLDGREFGSPEELSQQLFYTAENIRKYGIINQKGFDR